MERLIDVQELALALNIAPSQVYRLATRGDLPFLRVGRYLRFDLAAVLNALKAPNK